MHILIKQGTYILLGIIGFLTSIVYTQEQRAVVDFSHLMLNFQAPPPAISDPDVSDLAQAVWQIQHATLSAIDLSLTMGDDQQPDAARYEYRLTIQKDINRHIRKVHYSIFALQSGDLFDLEEYYDINGDLIFLEYVRFGRTMGGETETRELIGKIYVRHGQPIKNDSYNVRRTSEGIVRVRSQEMPEEYHLTVAALQKTSLRRIEGTLVRFRQCLQSPERLASRPASAIQQQYAQTVAFYEMLSAVFDKAGHE